MAKTNWDLEALSSEQLETLLKRYQQYIEMHTQELTAAREEFHRHTIDTANQMRTFLETDSDPATILILTTKEALKAYLEALPIDQYQMAVTHLLTDEKLGTPIDDYSFTPITEEHSSRPPIKWESLVWTNEDGQVVQR